MIQKIQKTLEIAFPDAGIEVVDESHLHKGHVGNTKNGNSHFKVVLKSDILAKMNKVQAHRKIHEALKELILSLHALSIEIKQASD